MWVEICAGSVWSHSTSSIATKPQTNFENIKENSPDNGQA